MQVTNKTGRNKNNHFGAEPTSKAATRLAPVDGKQFSTDYEEDNFNQASYAIMGALASKKPLPSPEYALHFAVYNAHLNSLAQRLLADLGVGIPGAAAKAVDQFHLEQLFGGFQEFLLSDEKCFLPTAVTAMRRICMSLA